MKKPALKRQLEVTQEQLDKFMSATATQAIRIMELEAEVAEAYKTARQYLCPWCCTFTAESHSELRMHEQQCNSNRNRWRPDAWATSYRRVLEELGIPENGLDIGMWPNTVLDHIRRLKHRARPTCPLCGSSHADDDELLAHLKAQHPLLC